MTLMDLWPVGVTFVGVVVVLAKMHAKQGVHDEQIKQLFEFHNHRDH